MSDPSKAVFLSYASQDAAAVRGIAEALRAAGVEVWFDQNELVGGDAWDAKIRRQIAECALFVPVISANTNARGEGYFRLEWKLAVDRSHLMAHDQPFLLPVVIDEPNDGAARVPPEFRAVQWTRLRQAYGGLAPDDADVAAFCARVGRLLAAPDTSASAVKRARQSTGATGVDVVVPSKHRTYGWTAAGVFVLAAVLAIWKPWHSQRDRASNPAAASSPASATDALVAKIRAIVEKDADATRDDWLLAENLGAEAVKQEPSNGRAWAAYAEGTLGLYVFYFDRTRDALADTLKHAQKAVSLAPDRDEGHVVLAAAYAVRRETRAEAEQMLRKLVARAPQDARRLRLLAATVRMKAASAQTPEDSPDYREIFALYDQAARDAVHAPLALREKAALLAVFGQLNEAETTLARSLALRPSPAATAQKLSTLLRFGRLDDAGALLDTMPGSYLLREDICELAAKAWLWKRDPARCLRVLNGWSEDFLSAIPKGLMIGQAQQLLNRPEAARLAWQAALAKVEQQADETAGTPQVEPYLYFRALLLARLGDAVRGEEARQRAEQAGRLNTTQRATLLLVSGKPAEAVDAVWQARDTYRRVWESSVNMSRVALGRSDLRFDPIWDPIRADPRFQAVLDAWDRHVTNQPADRDRAGAAPPDTKSVAVLPFANVSDDKTNEFFSDGISDELLNALAKVPGLQVTARTSAFSFKGKNTPVPEIARQLGVTYVVEGHVRKQGDKVRITAQLIKAADGFQLWSDTFNRDLKDIFAVQEEIAGLIGQQLQLKLGAATAPARAVNPEALNLLLEARYYWNQRGEQNLDRAEALLIRARAIDPEFARGHAALADVWLMRATYRLLDGGANVATELQNLRASATRAAQLDPGLIEPVAAQAYGLMLENRMAESGMLFSTVLGRSPDNPTFLYWRGLYLINQGDLHGAWRDYAAARKYDPMSFIIWQNSAECAVALGYFDEGAAFAARAHEVRPGGFVQSIASQAVATWLAGRREQAVALARATRQPELQQLPWLKAAYAIWVLRQAGLEAEATVYGAEELPTLPTQSYQRGFLLATLGRFAEAHSYLEKMPPYIYYLLASSPIFDPWREEAQFKALVEKLNWSIPYAKARATRLETLRR